MTTYQNTFLFVSPEQKRIIEESAKDQNSGINVVKTTGNGIEIEFRTPSDLFELGMVVMNEIRKMFPEKQF